MSSTLFLIAIIPVVIILYYVYKRDKHKEPIKLLIKLFASGIASCFLVFIISDIMEIIFPFMEYETNYMTPFQLFIYVFVGIALVEEGCKWIMTYLIGYNNKEFDEVYDIIVYSVFVSLGFAAFENILYVLGNTTAISSITTGILRGLLSVPGHACYGLYIGYFLSLAKVYSKKGRFDKEKIYLFLSLLVPTILHGIYDYCIIVNNNIFLIIFLIFVISLFYFSFRRLLKVSKESKNILLKNKFCANCGCKVSGPFCSNCGQRQE